MFLFFSSRVYTGANDTQLIYARKKRLFITLTVCQLCKKFDLAPLDHFALVLFWIELWM